MQIHSNTVHSQPVTYYFRNDLVSFLLANTCSKCTADYSEIAE